MVGTYRGVPLAVDLTGLTFIGSAGKEFPASIHSQGGKLAPLALMAKSIIEEITATRERENKQRGVDRMKQENFIVVMFLILSWLLAGGNLLGEDKPPLRLTLRDAVQLALKENPQVQIANLNVAQSAQDDTIARAALLP